MIQKSNVFSSREVSNGEVKPGNGELENLVTPYLMSETEFAKVNKNFRYSHTYGLVFDVFKEEGISFEVAPIYYLTADTPFEVLNKLKDMPGLILIGVEPEEGEETRLCYSDPRRGAPILVGTKISEYYIGKKYHKKIKGVEPVYKYADFSENQLRGALAVINKTRGVDITGNGSARLYEASLSSDLYQAYILKGGTKVYTRELLFGSYELMCNLGHPSTYKVAVLQGIYLPKTLEELTFEFSVDNNSFGDNLDKALIFATENSFEEIKITCGRGVVAKVGSRNWRFIKHAIAALSKVDFNSISNEEGN